MNASVIIPTYYRFHELSFLFDSLLKQTVKPGEVIVVDDTPNAKINTLCEKYAAKFSQIGVMLVYVKNCRERSISIARNLGGKMARGDIILFTDSDVMLCPDYIEKVLVTFKKYPEALGVGGWQRALIDYRHLGGFRYQALQILKKLFFLWHSSRNSYNNFEYALELPRPTYSKYLNGQSLSVKNSVLNEFQFDENLKGYSWMEDFLFSSSIYKKHPKSLLNTPDALYTHTKSADRPTGKNLVEIKRRNRKYVLIQLWGSKGLLLFGWQNLGIWIIKAIEKFRPGKLELVEE